MSTVKNTGAAPTKASSLFQKIQAVRVGLLAAKLKMTGSIGGNKNKPYMELSDFLAPLNQLMLENRFTAVATFDNDTARLTAYDFDSDQTLTITSPMREATLSGCHPIQNLGAVETYQRRYLYMAMFDIAESDILDGTLDLKGKPNGAPQAPPPPANKPTAAQLKQAQELGIKLENTATYFKVSVDSLTSEQIAEAIARKQAALKKQADATPPPPADQEPPPPQNQGGGDDA